MLKHHSIDMVTDQKRSGAKGWDILDLDLKETFGVVTQLTEKTQSNRTD